MSFRNNTFIDCDVLYKNTSNIGDNREYFQVLNRDNEITEFKILSEYSDVFFTTIDDFNNLVGVQGILLNEGDNGLFCFAELDSLENVFIFDQDTFEPHGSNNENTFDFVHFVLNIFKKNNSGSVINFLSSIKKEYILKTHTTFLERGG